MKTISSQKKELLLHYGLSGLITLFVVVFFAFLIFLMTLIPTTKNYGTTVLSFHINSESQEAMKEPSPKPVAKADPIPTAKPTPKLAPKSTPSTPPKKTTARPVSQPVQNKVAPIPTDDFVEAEFEDILVGTGKQTQKTKSDTAKKAVGVHASQGSQSQTTEGSINENLMASVENSLLESSQLEQLDQIAANEATPSTSTSTTSSTSTKTSENVTSGASVYSLEEYRKFRKMLEGGYPTLDEIDLAQRRFINVTVKLTVEPSGIVQKVQIIASSGSSEIDNAIVRALRYWKFERVNVLTNDEPLLKLYWRPGNEN